MTDEKLQELCSRIVKHADQIFVRAELNGTVQTVALTELPAREAIRCALWFVTQGTLSGQRRVVDISDPKEGKT